MPPIPRVLAVVLLASACGGKIAPETTPEPPRTHDDAAPTPMPSLPPPSPPEGRVGSFTWGPCPDGYERADACATAAVPLDWDVPSGKTIDAFVARIGSGTAKTQLFMLQGGPGGAAADLFDLATAVQQQRPDVDVILFEHRGVGAATRLGCPSIGDDTDVAGDVAAACARELQTTWGDGLRHFTTTNAARDLARAVSDLKPPGGRAFVYGVSYGTYVVHRLLQVAPTVADGAILDSAVPGTGATFDTFDAHGDPVLRRLADVCAASPTCRANLGADPWTAMATVLRDFDAMPCAAATKLTRLGLHAAVFSMLEDRTTSGYVPSLLFRASRCNAEDVSALGSVATQLALTGSTAPLGSGALYNTVVFSELWSSPPPTERALLERLRTTTLTTGGLPGASGEVVPFLVDLDRRRAVWPTYPRDGFSGRWAQTDTPVLVLNGDFDVQTPIEEARGYATGLAGPSKTFAFVPYANHGVIVQSPTRNGDVCGLRIVVDFLRSPSSPDTSCTTETLPPGVDGQDGLSQALFGTPTAWGASLHAPGATFAIDATSTAAAQERLRDALRRTEPFRRKRPALRRR